MHNVYLYRDRSGKEPVAEYIAELAAKKDKESRVKLSKIRDYIKMLSEYGTRAGELYIKHIDGEIWELRPLRDRILFVGWVNSSFVLLHQFMKKTQRTPSCEIEQAKREIADLKERGLNHE